MRVCIFVEHFYFHTCENWKLFILGSLFCYNDLIILLVLGKLWKKKLTPSFVDYFVINFGSLIFIVQ